MPLCARRAPRRSADAPRRFIALPRSSRRINGNVDLFSLS
jgi:hypothetical protein